MKFTTALVTGLAAFSTGAQANTCVVQKNLTWRYIIDAGGIPNASGVCSALWDNLKAFSACVASAPSCGVIGDDNAFRWEFTVGDICNGGMVESAWWEATKNQWGGISC